MRKQKVKNKVPMVRPASGWDYQRVTTSPGEMLAEEFLKPLGISQNQLALHTSLPMSRINAIIHGKRALSADTALRFARFFGNSPEFWLNLQLLHDLTKARLALGKTIETEVRQMVAKITPKNRYAEVSPGAEIGKEIVEW